MFKNLLPQEFYDHLNAGGIVVVIATFVKGGSHKPVGLAFSKTHLYHHKQLPEGSWISDDPVAAIKPGVTPEQLVAAHMNVLIEIADRTCEMMQIDFELATPKTVNYN